MRRIILAPLMTVILLLLASDIALGCRCPGLSEATTPGPLGEVLVKEFNEALAVFSGEVVERDMLNVKFKVDKLWKGNFGDEITMSTGAKDRGNGTFDLPSSCDYGFKLGEKYLVFAYGASAKEMKARKCTGTRHLKYAKQEMKNLDEVHPHKQINREPKDYDNKVSSRGARNLTTHSTRPAIAFLSRCSLAAKFECLRAGGLIRALGGQQVA